MGLKTKLKTFPEIIEIYRYKFYGKQSSSFFARKLWRIKNQTDRI